MKQNATTPAAPGVKTQEKRPLYDVLREGVAKLRARAEALASAELSREQVKAAAADLADRAARAAAMATEEAKRLLRPHQDEVRKIKAAWEPVIQEFRDVEAAAKGAAALVLSAERAEREAAEAEARRLREEAEARQREAQQRALAAEDPGDRAEAEDAAATAWKDRRAAGELFPAMSDTVARSASGAGLFEREDWRWEVVDEAAVPEEFTVRVVDAVKVEAAVREGRRDIPGLRVFKVATVVRQPARGSRPAGKGKG